MSDELRIRRDRSALAEGSLFARSQRRRTSRWLFGLWLLAMAGLGIVIWQFDTIQPKVLGVFGIAPTPTPTATDYFKRGDLAYWRGDLNTAILNYREAARLAPTNVDVLYELARMLIYHSYGDPRNAPDVAEAEKWGNQAVEADPGNARAHTILCFVQFMLGRSEDASRSCQRAINIDPKNADAHAYLSMAFSDLGRYSEALDEGLKAVTLNEKDIDAQTAYALALSYQNRPTAALDHYQKATEVNPRLEFPYFNLAGQAVQIAMSKDPTQFQLAIDIYNKILAMNKTNAKAYVRLCSTYLSIGETNLARDNCTTATTLDDQFTQAWRWLGEVDYRTEAYDKAVEAFDKCAQLETGFAPQDRQSECWYYRGLAWVQLGQCDKAIPIFSDLLSWTTSARAISLTNKGISICAAKNQPQTTQ